MKSPVILMMWFFDHVLVIKIAIKINLLVKSKYVLISK